MKKGILSLLVAFALVLGLVQPAQASETTPLNSTISKLLGIRYLAGGTSTRGFDCSGFTSFVFAQFKVALPHQSASQATLGTRVLKSNLRPGDLVFFNTNGRSISHVGIYTGKGLFAHAARQGIVVENMNSAYYAKRFVTARRILNDINFNRIAAIAPVNVVATAVKTDVEESAVYDSTSDTTSTLSSWIQASLSSTNQTEDNATDDAGEDASSI
jgi:hypothetical protein